LGKMPTTSVRRPTVATRADLFVGVTSIGAD
jgi:hypothetical protein